MLLLTGIVTLCSKKTPLDPNTEMPNYNLWQYKPISLAATICDTLLAVTITDSLKAPLSAPVFKRVVTSADSVVSLADLAFYPTKTDTIGDTIHAQRVTLKDTLFTVVRLSWSPPVGADLVTPDSLHKYYIYKGLNTDSTTFVKTDSVSGTTDSLVTMVITPPKTISWDKTIIPAVGLDLVYYYCVAIRKINRYEGAKSDLRPVTIPPKQ